ncbi:cysteine hydrolase family protein [Halomonas salifodinae]|uniref:cysteine hydrolase family protein n=1 Tax=Halomonas salifodinae TaxID=438745 RepID=UPI0033B52E83
MTPRYGSTSLRLCDARDESTALVIIDMQRAIDGWGEPSNPDLEANLAELLACWRGGSGHIVHVRHFSRSPGSPRRAGQPGAEFKDCVTPAQGERVLTKHVDSAFVGTDLEAWLRRHGVGHLVVAGVTTGHAVGTTVRHGACLGFSLSVVEDACACFPLADLAGRAWSGEALHQASLALLAGRYATITSTREVVQYF